MGADKVVGGLPFGMLASTTDTSTTPDGEKATLSPGTIAAGSGIGYAYGKGRKPDGKDPNQDSRRVHRDSAASSLYGVFDGHGEKGHGISYHVKRMLPKACQGVCDEEAQARVRATSERVQKTLCARKYLGAQMYGATATIMVKAVERWLKATRGTITDDITVVLGSFNHGDRSFCRTANLPEQTGGACLHPAEYAQSGALPTKVANLRRQVRRKELGPWESATGTCGRLPAEWTRRCQRKGGAVAHLDLSFTGVANPRNGGRDGDLYRDLSFSPNKLRVGRKALELRV